MSYFAGLPWNADVDDAESGVRVDLGGLGGPRSVVVALLLGWYRHARLTGKSIAYWGPRIPGLRERVKTLPQDEVCAWQWQETLNIARRDAEAYSAEQYREWRYEDLVTEPVRVVTEMFDFAEISMPTALRNWLGENIHARSLNKWREKFDDDAIARITPHMQPLLDELGYSD